MGESTGKRRESLTSNVKFNENSIADARRVSLDIPQGRRNSIKDRPLTPRASLNSIDQITNDIGTDIFNEHNVYSEIDTSAEKRKRKQTPFFAPSPEQQEQLVDESCKLDDEDEDMDHTKEIKTEKSK